MTSLPLDEKKDCSYGELFSRMLRRFVQRWATYDHQYQDLTHGWGQLHYNAETHYDVSLIGFLGPGNSFSL